MNTTGKILALAKDHDLWKQILILDETLFPRPWSESDWSTLDFSRHQLWAFCDENGLVGFALFAMIPGDETAHLLKIIILPELRGGTNSGLFWNEIAKNLRNLQFKYVFLEVGESNERAHRFYAKVGFQVLRRVKSYYSDGETGMMMQLTL